MKALTFRYLPGFLLMCIGLGGLFGWTLYRTVTDQGVLSPKGIPILVVVIAGNLFLWSAVIRLCQLHWRFTVTPTHLIAEHSLRGKRIEVPWEHIARVRKLPRAWWARGGGGLSVSQIETADGQTIPFMTHLMLRYKGFLAELKARAVNCREFDPYYSEWNEPSCPHATARPFGRASSLCPSGWRANERPGQSWGPLSPLLSACPGWGPILE